jgi:hypothetical protein
VTGGARTISHMNAAVCVLRGRKLWRLMLAERGSDAANNMMIRRHG